MLTRFTGTMTEGRILVNAPKEEVTLVLQDAAITNNRIGAYTVWDMNVNFKPVKNLDVSVGVNNMFDKGTVYSNSAYVDTYVNSMNDIVGRYIYLNARYKLK